MKHILLKSFILFCFPISIWAQPFTKVSSQGVNGITTGEVMWLDVENDNQLEFLVCGENQSNNEYTKLCRLTGNSFGIDQTISLQDYSESSFDTADFNNDGFVDVILTGNFNGVPSTRLYYNDGLGNFNVQQVSLLGTSYGVVRAADFNNDGRQDFVIVGQNASYVNTAQLYLQDNSGAYIATASTIVGINTGSMIVFDANNDTYPDVLVSGFDANYATTTKLFINNGSAVFTESLTHNIPGMYLSSFSAGDYDNDGDLDLAISGKETYTQIKTQIMVNNGNGDFTVDPAVVLAQTYYGAIDMDDVDNDGDLDILVTGQDSSSVQMIHYYQNNNGVYNPIVSVADSMRALSLGTSTLGDYDNDGDLDVIITGWDVNYQRQLDVYENLTPAIPDTCHQPTHVMFSNITNTTAIVDWTENNGATEWDIQYVPQGSSPAATGTNITTKPYTLTGLNSHTDYDFYIRTNCTDTSSIWAGPFSFSTLPDTCHQPTNVTFSNTTSSSIDADWVENNGATDWEIQYVMQGGTPAATGTNITTKPYTLTGLNSNTNYDFYIRTNCTDTNSNWAGPFSFSTLPAPCLQPTDLAASNVTATSADIDWTENNGATEWIIEYVVAGNAPTQVGTTILTKPYALTGLTPYTSYEVYLATECTDDVSDWSGPLLFTTETAVGINEIDNDQLSVFPLPASSNINVQLGSSFANQAIEVSIVDMLGKTQLTTSKNTNRFTLDISHLSEGIYFITINNESLKITKRISVVK